MNTNYALGLEYTTEQFLGLSRLADYSYQALSTPFRDTSLSERIANRSQYWDMAEQRSANSLRKFFNVDTDSTYFSFMDQQLNPSQNMAMGELPMPSGAARTVTRKVASQSRYASKTATNIQRQLFQNKKVGSYKNLLNCKVAKSYSRSKFPMNPNELLRELPRDSKGRIYPSDFIRIRPEIHPLKPGEKFYKRHHSLHYHVEFRKDPKISWNNKSNVRKIKSLNYKPGEGTGFLPGEYFPGI